MRVFESDEIIHVENGVDPIRDIDIVNLELTLKDLETVDKRMHSLEKEFRADKKKEPDLETLKKARTLLEAGNMLFATDRALCLEPVIKELTLLTAKPQIYLLNGSPEDVTDALKEKIASLKAEYVIYDLSSDEDLGRLIRKAYGLLGLISFFTTGEDESRAWTITRGSKAPQAAGTIHTDFEKKFIRAEVIATEKLLEIGSWAAAKQKGLIRVEGKEYVVLDGDMMVIRHG